MDLQGMVFEYLLLYVIFEAYEIAWQKAQTLLGVLAKMFHYYKKNVWLFFIMQPTFYFALLFMLLLDFNIYSVILFSLKGSDVLTKIILMKKVFIDKRVEREISDLIVAPIPQFMLYLGMLLYPVLIFLALS